jgi:hypothetical protein
MRETDAINAVVFNSALLQREIMRIPFSLPFVKPRLKLFHFANAETLLAVCAK